MPAEGTHRCSSKRKCLLRLVLPFITTPDERDGQKWVQGKLVIWQAGMGRKKKAKQGKRLSAEIRDSQVFCLDAAFGELFFFFFNAREAPTGNAPVAGRNGFQEIVISLQAIPGDFARRQRGKVGEMDLAAPLGRSFGANPGWRQQQPCMSHGWRQKGRWGNSITADPTRCQPRCGSSQISLQQGQGDTVMAQSSLLQDPKRAGTGSAEHGGLVPTIAPSCTSSAGGEASWEPPPARTFPCEIKPAPRQLL